MASSPVLEEPVIRSENATKPFYRPELDTLRFFAFLAVFAIHGLNYSSDALVQRHIPLWTAKIIVSLVTAGSYGVDLFFVLSAYLITELLIREKTFKGALNVKAFYLRRILRIWPLYYVFLALVALIPFLNDYHGFPRVQLLGFSLLMGNWSVAAFGWPTTAAVPLWSISVEEQFYLFWPPFVARLSRKQIAIAAAGMILIANVVRFMSVLLHFSAESLWVNTFAHLDSIAAGILVAVFLNGRIPRINILNRVSLIVMSVACLGIRNYFFSSPMSLSQAIIGYSVDAAACAAVLVAFIGFPLRSVWLEYLGKISYGLYVYHMMCIMIANRLLGGRPNGSGLAHFFLWLTLCLGLTVATAALSYAFLEKPFLKLKNKYTYVLSRTA